VKPVPTESAGKSLGNWDAVRPGEEMIYRVACRIFRERGYHATSMRAIASALSLQPAALYYYYPSKEDLLYSIMDTAVDALTERVLQEIDPLAPAPVRLRQAMRAHITAVADHLDELSVFLHELKGLSPPRRALVQAKRDRYEHIFRDIVQDGAAKSELAEVDSRLAGFLILAACNWLYNWYRPDGSFDPEEIATAFSEMILTGLCR
jgi:TetR/AcrR family transcriptional regulator, cholesterol catabolism regulator